MEFLAEYSLFFVKLVSIIIVLLFMMMMIFVLFARNKAESAEHLEIHHLNDQLEQMQLTLNTSLLDKKQLKQLTKDQKKKDKKHKSAKIEKQRLFVLKFKGDIRASEASSLSDEITAIFTVIKPDDEILVILESAGGTVHGYGYAASQLARIKDNGNRLTVAVDKVAASGGYMMACVADHIIAAPFAIIGSIGVLTQIPNFNKLLKKNDIEFEEITAGKHKRTVTMFGENSDEDRRKLQDELEQTHSLFKEFVKAHRQQVDIDNIATGEHWYGKQALDLKLVDELSTSDSYLYQVAQERDVYLVNYIRKRSFIEKLFATAYGFFVPTS